MYNNYVIKNTPYDWRKAALESGCGGSTHREYGIRDGNSLSRLLRSRTDRLGARASYRGIRAFFMYLKKTEDCNGKNDVEP